MATARGAYADRLDDDYWLYVDAVNAAFPADAAALPIAAQRALYDAMSRRFHPGRPLDITVEDMTIDGPGGRIPIRLYRKKAVRPSAVVLYFHGGGFVFGGLYSHDDTCSDLCAGTGLEIFSVDYRLAPEHPHPAAFTDALAAWRWLLAGTDRPIVLAGESAGGTLAATVAHAVRNGSRSAAGQLMIYPMLGGKPGHSHRAHAFAPLLSLDDVETCRRAWSGGEPPPGDPTFEPLADPDFSGLPPTVVVTAECDPLSSEGEAYCKAVRAAGGSSIWREEQRLTHSFLRARASVPRASEAFSRIVDDLSMLAATKLR